MERIKRERERELYRSCAADVLFTLGAMGGAQYDTKYRTVGAASGGDPLIEPPIN